MKESEENLSDLWDLIEHSTICIMKAPEEKKEERKDQKAYAKKEWMQRNLH